MIASVNDAAILFMDSDLRRPLIQSAIASSVPESSDFIDAEVQSI